MALQVHGVISPPDRGPLVVAAALVALVAVALVAAAPVEAGKGLLAVLLRCLGLMVFRMFVG